MDELFKQIAVNFLHCNKSFCQLALKPVMLYLEKIRLLGLFRQLLCVNIKLDKNVSNYFVVVSFHSRLV